MGKFIVLVVDGLGIGAMEDVKLNRKQDIGANTLKNIFIRVNDLKLPNLERLGIMNALDYETKYMKKSKLCNYGVCNLNYVGADSFMGHQEIMGETNLKKELIPFSKNADFIYNLLNKYGYNVEYIYVNKIYKMLLVDKSILIGDSLEGDFGEIYNIIVDLNKTNYNFALKLGKLIRKELKVSRITVKGSFIELEKLIDFIEYKDKCLGVNLIKSKFYNDKRYKNINLPFYKSNSEQIQYKLYKKNIDTVLIGKAGDIIFNPCRKSFILNDTKDILDLSLNEISKNKNEFILINVQGTDIAGHMQDVYSYACELKIIDGYLKNIIKLCNKDDIFIVTGDHGNDPTIGHNKHTREKVPILLYKENMYKGNIGNFKSLSCIANFAQRYFKV